jgi:hypothetical protein
VIALIGVPRVSRAADPVLALDYEVQQSCPTREAFSDLVRDKLTAAGAPGSLEEPRVTVRIHAADSGFIGDLSLQRADASSYEREVGGASCAEVANALAFVLALALGAKELAAAPVVAPAPSATEPPPPPAPPVSPPASAMSAPARPRQRPVPKQPSAWRLGLGVQAAERAGLAPRSVLVGSAFLQAARVLAPLPGIALRAGFAIAQSASVKDPNGTTDFSWWAGSVEACPLRLRVLGPLELRPCAAVDLGRLRVQGTPVPGPGSAGASASKIWADVLAALRLELPLSRWLSAELQGDLIVPLSRYQVAFNPEATVYQIPGLAGGGRLGLSAHFP